MAGMGKRAYENKLVEHLRENWQMAALPGRKMNRDKTLDCLRGWAMLQVVFVHAMYWLYSIEPTVARSFLLFEMLLFFYVTGAVNSLKETGPYGSFCIKRIKGIMIPYWIYAAICVAIAVAYCPGPGAPTPGVVSRIILSWLVPVNAQIMPLWFYAWALWFVPVYLVSIVLFPPVRKLVLRYGRASIAFLVLAFIVVGTAFGLSIEKVPDPGAGSWIHVVHLLSDIVQESFFYVIFMGIGVLHSRLKVREKGDLAMSAAILAISVAGLCVSGGVFGHSLDMQENKFPPNLVFLFYSFAFMTLLHLVFPPMKKLYRLLAKALPPVGRLVMAFSENSITVFLYQPFAFWGTYLVLRNFGLRKTAWEPYVAVPVVYLLVWLMIKGKNLVGSLVRSHLRRTIP